MTRTDFAQTGFITRRTFVLGLLDMAIQTLLLIAVMVMLSGFIYLIH